MGAAHMINPTTKAPPSPGTGVVGDTILAHYSTPFPTSVVPNPSTYKHTKEGSGEMDILHMGPGRYPNITNLITQEATKPWFVTE